MVRARFLATSVLGLLIVSGAGARLIPGNDGDSAGVPLSTVLGEYGCLMPTVAAQELAPWPEAWKDLRMPGGDVSPARVVRDPWPNFHSVAVDTVNNRVFFSDSNRHGYWIYDRTAGSLDSTDPVEPIAGVRGPVTGMMFVASIAVDPDKREIYTVDNDIGDRLMTYWYDAVGNAKPVRGLHVPHQAWGIGLGRKRGEVAVSIEGANTVVVYKQGVDSETKPLRTLRGVKTMLADPHGVQFDDTRNVMVVANHGNQAFAPSASRTDNIDSLNDQSQDAAPAGGRWLPPSITVFAADANGNAAPLRTIVGGKTGLDWPMGISIDSPRGEFAVANNGDSSVRVFRIDASGDVAPVRVIRGDKTGIVGPMNVAIDTTHGELWVSNYGDHTGLVFDWPAAEGNVSPKRILRNAPKGAPTSGFGNPGAVTYDTKRKEIIVPN